MINTQQAQKEKVNHKRKYMGKINRWKLKKNLKEMIEIKKCCNKKLMGLLIDWARLEKRTSHLEEMSI